MRGRSVTQERRRPIHYRLLRNLPAHAKSTRAVGHITSPTSHRSCKHYCNPSSNTLRHTSRVRYYVEWLPVSRSSTHGNARCLSTASRTRRRTGTPAPLHGSIHLCQRRSGIDFATSHPEFRASNKCLGGRGWGTRCQRTMRHYFSDFPSRHPGIGVEMRM